MHGSASDRDFVLVNGGWQPKLTMEVRRCRLLRLLRWGKMHGQLPAVARGGPGVPAACTRVTAHDGACPRTYSYGVEFLRSSNSEPRTALPCRRRPRCA